MPVTIFCAVIVCTYLLGSLSFAYWAGRCKGVDLREHGSGNIGATNAGRVLGKQWFFVVFFADVCKGLGPVLLMRYAAPQWIDWQDATLLRDLLPISAALAAVLGHSFTCFHGFKGGKAVATSLGVILGLTPIVAGLAFAAWLLTWLLVAAIWKLKRSDAVGPASIVAAIACPAIHFAINEQTLSMPTLPSSILIVLIALLVLIRHRSNAQKFLGSIRHRASE